MDKIYYSRINERFTSADFWYNCWLYPLRVMVFFSWDLFWNALFFIPTTIGHYRLRYAASQVRGSTEQAMASYAFAPSPCDQQAQASKRLLNQQLGQSIEPSVAHLASIFNALSLPALNRTMVFPFANEDFRVRCWDWQRAQTVADFLMAQVRWAVLRPQHEREYYYRTLNVYIGELFGALERYLTQEQWAFFIAQSFPEQEGGGCLMDRLCSKTRLPALQVFPIKYFLKLCKHFESPPVFSTKTTGSFDEQRIDAYVQWQIQHLPQDYLWAALVEHARDSDDDAFFADPILFEPIGKAGVIEGDWGEWADKPYLGLEAHQQATWDSLQQSLDKRAFQYVLTPSSYRKVMTTKQGEDASVTSMCAHPWAHMPMLGPIHLANLVNIDRLVLTMFAWQDGHWANQDMQDHWLQLAQSQGLWRDHLHKAIEPLRALSTDAHHRQALQALSQSWVSPPLA